MCLKHMLTLLIVPLLSLHEPSLSWLSKLTAIKIKAMFHQFLKIVDVLLCSFLLSSLICLQSSDTWWWGFFFCSFGLFAVSTRRYFGIEKQLRNREERRRKTVVMLMVLVMVILVVLDLVVDSIAVPLFKNSDKSKLQWREQACLHGFHGHYNE